MDLSDLASALGHVSSDALSVLRMGTSTVERFGMNNAKLLCFFQKRHRLAPEQLTTARGSWVTGLVIFGFCLGFQVVANAQKPNAKDITSETEATGELVSEPGDRERGGEAKSVRCGETGACHRCCGY